jgi:hypothetical protein
MNTLQGDTMTTAIIPERLTEVTHLDAGSHRPGAGAYCAMELVAYVAGEAHSARPDCACPVIAAYTMRLNDALGTRTASGSCPSSPASPGRARRRRRNWRGAISRPPGR